MTGYTMPLNIVSPSKDKATIGKVNKLPRSIRITKADTPDFGSKQLFKVVKPKKPREALINHVSEIRPPFSEQINLADKEKVSKAQGAAISSHFQLNPLFVNKRNQKYRNDAVLRYWRKKFVSRNRKHVY